MNFLKSEPEFAFDYQRLLEFCGSWHYVTISSSCHTTTGGPCETHSFKIKLSTGNFLNVAGSVLSVGAWYVGVSACVSELSQWPAKPPTETSAPILRQLLIFSWAATLRSSARFRIDYSKFYCTLQKAEKRLHRERCACACVRVWNCHWLEFSWSVSETAPCQIWLSQHFFAGGDFFPQAVKMEKTVFFPVEIRVELTENVQLAELQSPPFSVSVPISDGHEFESFDFQNENHFRTCEFVIKERGKCFHPGQGRISRRCW
jgi:hypothetical protein